LEGKVDPKSGEKARRGTWYREGIFKRLTYLKLST